MTRFGLDSTTMVPVAAHRAAGSTVALRYLSRYSWKILKAFEVGAYRSAGIDLVAVFEDGARNCAGGRSQGVSDAQFALWQAGTLGMPAGRPIYFAVDFNASQGDQAAINAYLQGCASVIGAGRVGVYGSYYVCRRAFDAGVAKYGWQTYAWSGGQLDRRCQVYQYSNGHIVGGVDVDYNHIYAADFGQWHNAPRPVPPKPPTPPEGTVNGPYPYTNADGRVGWVVGLDNGEVKHIEQKEPNGDWWKNPDGTWDWLSKGNPTK